ncbi:MAG: hypothetical protein ACK4SF_00145 [Algoriphagus aquaeductus]|jgi:hypothetical protein|uniref:DoxX-like protein n=1 Tax=Algoriphagus aquaeductus TaxID=475299 RepID=A0A326RWH0_9BACT|nr:MULTISPECIES: hypothetical protein [Algoriphagus]PZV86410.1 hypothetical protein CLV31_102310 [Algoriphagus aquaeductus]
MDQNTSFPTFPMHFRGLLLLAGMYTIAWSAFYKWFGPELLKWMSMGDSELAVLPSNYFGTFGILIGLVIFVSAFYPVSWVWLILAGVTGKIITAIWFTLGFAPELSWNKRSIFHLVFNELIWLIPLILIFLRGLQVKNYLQDEESKV